jgi:hypothetical protein
MKVGLACIWAIGIAALCAIWVLDSAPAIPKAPPGAVGGSARGPLKGTPGVTYSSGPTLRHKLPHAGPGTTYSIYTLSANPDAPDVINFHGFNRYGCTLSNASDTRLATDLFGRTLESLDPSVRFETIYPAHSKKVGRWAGADTIVAAISTLLAQRDS